MPPPATETIWTQMSSDLRRFIRRRVSDDHLADDLLQETFVRIHRGIGTLQDVERLLPWLYQIARNVIIDHQRQQSKNAAARIEDIAAESDSSDSRHCHGCQWIDELVRQLPEKYREAVLLAEIEGLTQQEIADRLGLSLSGVKSRVQRGREMLKGVFDQCCVFHFDRRGNLLDYDPRPDRKVCLDCDE